MYMAQKNTSKVSTEESEQPLGYSESPKVSNGSKIVQHYFFEFQSSKSKESYLLKS